MEPAGQIYQLIPKVMIDVGAIAKGRKNQQQGYSFRGIDDLYNAMQPTMAKHGVFMVPKVIDQKREERQSRQGAHLVYTVLTVAFTLYAPDGSHVEAVTVGEAMDSGDKSCNKAMSAAQKYAMLEVFCIPTEDDKDSENNTHDLAPRRESANRQTGEAAPIGDGEAFAIQVREAFDAGDYQPAERQKVTVAVLRKSKIRGLHELPAERRQELLDKIARGEFDQLIGRVAAGK